MMSLTIPFVLFSLLQLQSVKPLGFSSGVPCHRPYSCILEENEDGFENSILLASESGISDEKVCQMLCFELENCVSYTWWNEKASDELRSNENPFECQLFSVCHRNYHNPNLTPVFSGKTLKMQTNCLGIHSIQVTQLL